MTKLWWNGRGWSPSKIVSGIPDLQPTWSLLLKIKKWDAIFKIFISETTRPIRTKLYLHNSWMTPFHIVSGNPDIHPTWPLLLKIEKGMKFYLFSSETTGPIGFKLCWNNALVIPFQNFVWQPRPQNKMDAVTKNFTIPCTLSRMQGFTCLIKSYKTNMFRLFQWNTVRRRI